MNNYRGVIVAEILALLAFLVIVSLRGKLLWYTLLGQTTAVQGTPPAKNVQYGYTFTTLGVVIGAIVAVKFGKGTFGLLVAYFLGIMLAATLLLNYQAVLNVITTYTNPPASSPKGVQ